MMAKKYPFLIFILVTAILITVFSSACAPKEARSIKIGQVMDLTGPIAGPGKILVEIGQMTVQYINDFKGGLNGVKLEWLWRDDGFSPPRSVSAFQSLKGEGIVLLINQNSTSAVALAPLAEREKVPIISMGVEPHTLFPPGWVYTAYPPTNTDVFLGALYWIKGNWKEARPPKVAILGWDNALGRAPLLAKRYWEELGIQIAGQDFLPVFAVDWSAPLLKARDAGADYIFVSVSHPASEFTLRDAERIGIRVKIPIIMNGLSVQIHDTITAVKELAEGIYWVIPFNLSPDIPGIKEYMEAQKKVWGREPRIHSGDIHAWGALMVATEAINRAIKTVGADKVTGAEVKKALNSFKDFDTGGITNPITYGADNRRGGSAVWAYQVKDGKAVLISQKINVPFVKP